MLDLSHLMDELSTLSTNEDMTEREDRKDTLRPDLGQPLDLAGAAGQRLGHNKEQVGVVDPLGVEEPARDSDGCSADCSENTPQADSAEASENTP